MLDELQEIATKRGLSFEYGELQAFNKKADKLDCWPVLYHEGYIQGEKALDLTGAIETNYTLSLWILRKSALSDSPDKRIITINELCDVADTILSDLQASYRLTSARIQEGINLTDKNLDGVRLQLSAKTRIPKKVCSA